MEPRREASHKYQSTNPLKAGVENPKRILPRAVKTARGSASGGAKKMRTSPGKNPGPLGMATSLATAQRLQILALKAALEITLLFAPGNAVKPYSQNSHRNRGSSDTMARIHTRKEG